ncbi:MAG: GNAT family N-acetyltransferase [Bacteroidia bacterium]
MNLLLSPLQSDKISLVQQMARRIWDVHYTPIIGQTQVDYMLGRFYTTEHITSQMAEGQQFYFVLLNGMEVGYTAISEISEGNYFIHKLYLEIDKQRKGMGSEVFRQLLALMGNLEAVRLQVNRQNLKAINFYFKMGFVIEQVADFDIGDGYFMNDFVMVYRPK